LKIVTFNGERYGPGCPASADNLADFDTEEDLGPVDKVDSQISKSVIQDCLLGGGFGSRRPDGYGMADH
jgi:hypothetical protein